MSSIFQKTLILQSLTLNQHTSLP